MHLVLIEWVDSASTPGEGWKSVSDFKGSPEEPLYCRSVGWLVNDGKDAKTVVPHFTAERDAAPHQGRGDITIPTVAITKLTRLRGHDIKRPE